MWSELSDDEDIARPQFPELSATLPQAKSPHELDEEGVVNDVPHIANNDLPQAKLPHKLDEEGVVNNIPHVADDNDEDSARPQLPPVALPQAESPHKLDKEDAVDNVPHIADNNNEDSARPQLPPVTLPQTESPHELAEEGVVNNIPQVEVNDKDGQGVFGLHGISVFLWAIFISWLVGCRYMNKEFGHSEGLCLPQSNHIGIMASMKTLAW